MQGENKKLKQYLIGALSEGQTEELDLLIISDESFAAEMSLAEHELCEDYLEGVLSSEETDRFESNFLVNAERHAMLREISLLKEFAKKKTRSVKLDEPLTKPSTGFGGFLALYFRPLMAGAAILIAVFALGLVWNSYFRDTRSPLEREYAELNKRDLNDLAQLENYSPVNLNSGTFRDTATTPKQSAENLTETVLFRLALPVNTVEGSSYRAKIRRVGPPEFAIDNIRAYRNPHGYEIRMLVPKSILQKGQYQIVVESKNDGANLAPYVFTVE